MKSHSIGLNILLVLFIAFSYSIYAQDPQWDGEQDFERQIFRLGQVGIGFDSYPHQSELLMLNGALTIGNAVSEELGTIKWDGRDFLGFTSSGWQSFTTTGNGYWGISGNNIYNTNQGNVGIGTSNPLAKLSVAGNRAVIGGNAILGSYVTETVTEIQSNNNSIMALVGGISGSNRQVLSLFSSPTVGMVGIHSTASGTSSPLPFTFFMQGSEKMRINVNGNVGIGTSVPDAKLHIFSDIPYSNWTEGIHLSNQVNENTYNSYIVQRAGAGLGFKANGGFSFIDEVSGSNFLLRISSNGRVGIGNIYDPTEKLEVDGAIKIGNTTGNNPGTIRWTGSDFQVHNGTEWKSLLSSSNWSNLGDDIYNNNIGKVLIGQSGSYSQLVIEANNNPTSWDGGITVQANLPQVGYSRGNITQTEAGITLKSDDGYTFLDATGTSTLLKIKSNGNIGFGISNPTSKLEVNGETFINSESPATDLLKIASVTTEGQSVVNLGISSNYFGRLSLGRFDPNPPPPGSGGDAVLVEERIVLNTQGTSYFYASGGLVIGNTQITPGYAFDVAGKIRANEIVVNTGGADFVFNDNYKLKNLTEVENFIKENKHLPEIPTEEEVQENGVSLGEMQTKLLQKIEELTLYIIEQEKRIKELEEKQ